MTLKNISLSLIFAAIFSNSFAFAVKASQQPAVGLTVYNENFAVVRQSRQMAFAEGTNTVKFTDVATAIDPTSVNFRCLSEPGAVSILEQNYEYDLVGTHVLMKRYIDKDIAISIKGSGADTGKQLTGTLLAAIGSDLILKTKTGGIEIINKACVEEISLRQLPEDLVTKPTLIWLADSKKKAEQLCEVTYTTEQIGWKADYSAVLNKDYTRLDFSGWVTIDNKSGATYKDAQIKLIAGDVRRVTEPLYQPRFAKTLTKAESAGFGEKPFMEYHMYTLGRKSTVNNNQVKQIEFIDPAIAVTAKKLYIYERWKKPDKVQVKIEFENTKANKLGIALPKGKVRVFKKDPADDSLEFVGEDEIDHTPKKEKLSLYIGDAFDIAAEYKTIDSRRSRRKVTQTNQIELRNRKDETVTVFVDERFGAWTNWRIDQSTHKYEKRDAGTARFEIKLTAETAVTLKYTVTKTW